MNRLEHRLSWISRHLKRGFNHQAGSPKPKSHSSFLRSYESAVSNALSQLVSVIKSNPTIPSLSWAHQALHFLINIHKNLQRLAADSNHSFEKWSFRLADEYLTHSLNLLDLLNSLTKNLSLIHQHMLPLLFNLRDSSMRPPDNILLQDWLRFVFQFKPDGYDREIEEESSAIAVEDESSETNGGEGVLRIGMESAKNVSLFLMKVLSFCFCGDFDSMVGMKVPLGHEWSVGLMDLQMKVCEEMLNRRTEKEGIGGLFFQEVIDVNETVRNLLRYISTDGESREKTYIVDDDSVGDDLIMLNILKGDVKEKVGVLAGCLDALEMEVDSLFTLVLQARSQLLDALDRKNL